MDAPTLAFIALVGLGIFLLVRVFWLWYWRVNVVVNALNAHTIELRGINARLAQIEEAQALELRDANARLALIDKHLMEALTPTTSVTS